MCKFAPFLRMLICISLCLVMPSAMASPDQDIEITGVNIPSRISMHGLDTKLVLNGAGIRYKFFFKVYIAALYLPKVENSDIEVLKSKSPNRLLMHITYSEVPYKKLVDGWVDGFKNNTSKSIFSILEPRLIQFNQMFSNLHEGDVVLLDYLPGKGTRVTIKGVEKGIIKGADFNRALLSVWLGENPVTEELKSVLLGLPND